MHFIKQILLRKTFKRKFIRVYQEQNLKQDFSNHKKSFNYEKRKTDMQLSNKL